MSYIIIDGLSVADSRWVEAEDAHHIIIRNCTFTNSPASGTTGNVRFISSHYNRIENSVIDDGQDNLLLFFDCFAIPVGFLTGFFVPSGKAYITGSLTLFG